MNKEQLKRLEENRRVNHNLAERLKAEKQPEEPGSRIRESFREDAERRNPNPAVTVLDSRGRPKAKSNNHQWVGQP